jgi:molybdenum cofactor cytidylyltransferase
MSVAAIILAAGRGTRFGDEPKLLAELEGRPLVRHVAEAALRSSARPIVLVAGHRAADVRQAVADLPLLIIVNDRHEHGLSTSLQLGFRNLPGDIAAAIVLLADMPRIHGPLIDRLIDAWTEAGGPAALIPTFGGERGNPVVLSSALRPDIETLKGDMGAGPILRRRDDVVLHPVEDPAVVQDVDTVDALAVLQN